MDDSPFLSLLFLFLCSMNSSPLVDSIPFLSLEREKDERAIVIAAADAAITTTMTQFQMPPIASPTFSLSSPSFSSILYYTTTITTTATFTAHSSSYSTPLELLSFDSASPWHHLFPALVVFAILGALSALMLLILLSLCFYRRQRRRQQQTLEENDLDTSNRPPFFGHTEKVQTPTSTSGTLHHLGIPETSNHNPALQYSHQPHPHHQQQGYYQHPTFMFPVSGSAPTQQPHHISTIMPHPVESSLASPVSSTFVPIETSPLTLVPRAAIWKDPQRRRGVNELDLWEQKQQQQQQQQQQQRCLQNMATYPHALQQIDLAPNPSTSSTHDGVLPVFTPFPYLQRGTTTPEADDYGDDDDSGSTTADASLDNGRDRPWQRYVQSSSRPVDLFALNNGDDDDDDDDDGEDQHSLHSSSTILHSSPIYNLNQENGDLSAMEMDKNEDPATRNRPIDTHGRLEDSGGSQWLCPPSSFKS